MSARRSSGFRLRCTAILAFFLPILAAMPPRHGTEPGLILQKRSNRMQLPASPSHTDIFEMYDIDSDGYLTPMELVLLLQRPDHINAVDEFVRRLKTVFTASERNGDGKLDFAEFTKAVAPPSRDPTEIEASGAFEIFDTNGDRILNYTEVAGAIQRMTGTTLSTGLIEKMFGRADTNGDGAIDKDEFSRSMQVLDSSALRV